MTAEKIEGSADVEKNVRRKSISAFKTISEVADELEVAQHVLRFWETKFNQIQPVKRGGGRRYYRPEDVKIIKFIKNLLYAERYTIEGVQKLFKEKGIKFLLEEEEKHFIPFISEEENETKTEELTSVVDEFQGRSQSPINKNKSLDNNIFSALIRDLEDVRNKLKEVVGSNMF